MSDIATGERSGPKSDRELLKAVGARVRARREQLGLTQRQVAERSGVTRPSIAQIEGGRHGVSLPQMAALCHALDWTPNDLLGWGDQ